MAPRRTRREGVRRFVGEAAVCRRDVRLEVVGLRGPLETDAEHRMVEPDPVPEPDEQRPMCIRLDLRRLCLLLARCCAEKAHESIQVRAANCDLASDETDDCEDGERSEDTEHAGKRASDDRAEDAGRCGHDREATAEPQMREAERY